jgi:serine/threonine protein kinase
MRCNQPLYFDVDSHSGNSDRLDQLNVIFNVIGTPDDEAIDNFDEVSSFLRKLPKKPRISLASKFPKAEPEAIDLLERMLEFNPNKRITVEEALEHPFMDATKDRYKASSCPFQISMDFENKKMDTLAIKELVFKEVCCATLFNHTVRTYLLMAYDL